MKRVFADTGYWVALLNPRDDLHQKALELSQKMGLIETDNKTNSKTNGNY